VAGLLGYLGHVSFSISLAISFTLAASFGTLVGAYLAQFVSAQQLQKSFGYFLLSVAAFVLLQNQSVFHKSARNHSTRVHQNSHIINKFYSQFRNYKVAIKEDRTEINNASDWNV
jgi:hypothetical protein